MALENDVRLMSQDSGMTCHNCERQTSWLRTRCRTCQSRLPAWYVVTVMAICAAIYIAFLLLENVF